MDKLIALIAVVVLAGACGGAEDEPALPAPDPDFQGSWTLASGHSASGDIPLVDGYPITFLLDGEQASGSAACNSYGGPVSVEGSEFDAGSFAVSEVGCEDEVMQSQERYLEALEDAEEIAVEGKTLTLTGTDTELVFRRVPPVETEALVDTRWELQTLLEGAAPDAPATKAKGGDLTLRSDGTFEGSTGCRTFSGEWATESDTIVFTTMTFAGTCRPALMDQEQHVVAVLGAGFRPQVDGRELTTTAARGPYALVYRAAG